MARLTEKHIESEIARLRGLDLPTLRKVWEKHFGSAPKRLRRGTLIRAILWHIQAQAIGVLKPTTRRYLGEIADAAHSNAPTNPLSPVRIRAGTKLIRVWQGRTYIVTVLEDGFEWQSKRHRSLSQIARSITGTRWNGPVFFGVKRPQTQPNMRDRERADA